MMKKKNELKKKAIMLDLEKIDIDELSKSMLNGIQGGYGTQNCPPSVICNTQTCNCPSVWPNYCPTGWSCTCFFC
ncbi:MAG: hypothetical protein EPN88_14105 [Bacteroidetes bacterium]|nr:MAG: hypothetical protein EPN88_14105 [Bacteroidota bacterium]